MMLAGDVCSTAEAAMSGMTVMGTTVGYANDLQPATSCTGFSTVGVDRVYSITIPAGQRLTAVVTPQTGYDSSIYFVQGPSAQCTMTPTCLDGDDSGGSGSADTATYDNTGTTPLDVFIVIDSYTTGSSGEGTFSLTATLANIPPPPVGSDTCNPANPITANLMLTGETLVGATADYDWGLDPGCTNAGYLGVDRAYAVQLGDGQQLTVNITRTSGSYTPSLQIALMCPATNNMCLASSPASGATNTLTYINRSGATQQFFLLVDTASTSGLGTYDLSFAFAMAPPVPPGDVCATAPTLDAGTTRSDSLVGATDDYTSTGSTGCSLLTGLDRTYAVSIPAGQRGIFSASPDAGGDVSLSLIPAPASNCTAPRTCTAAVNSFTSSSSGNRTEVLARYNTGTTAEDYLLIVDSTGATDLYDVAMAVDTPPTGDRCENPLALTSGVAQMGDFATFVNDYFGSGSGCNFGSARSDAVYSISVPAGQNLNVSVTPAAGLDTTISVATSAAACSSRTCVANATGGGAGAVDNLALANSSAMAQTYLIIVDHTTIGTASTFSITATITAPTPGETCGNAVAPTLMAQSDGGFAALAESMSGYLNDFAGGGNCAPGSFSSIDRVYQVTVPPGRTVFGVVPAAGWNPSLSIIEAPASTCTATPRACISGADRTTTTGPAGFENVGVSNTGTAARDYFLVVDTSTTTPASFDLFQNDGPLVPGEDCASAETLTTAGLTNQTTVGYDNDNNGNSSNGCAGSVGRDRVYRVSVPSGQKLTATVTPDAGFNPAVDLLLGESSCYTRQCVATANVGGTSAPDTVAWTNASAAAVDVYISVDSTSFTTSTGTGGFDITASLAAPMQGETCSNAIPVMNGTMLSGSVAGFSRETYVPTDGNNCQAYAGRDIVYEATVPAGQTINAVLSGTTGDPVINLIAGPASNCVYSPVCLAGADDPENVTWMNSTGSAVTVYIVVSNFSATTTTDATYSLAVTIN